MRQSSVQSFEICIFKVSYFSICMISNDSFDLQNHLLKLINIYLRLVGQFKWDQNIICFFQLIIIHIFSEIRSHGTHQRGRDFATLTPPTFFTVSALNAEVSFSMEE